MARQRREYVKETLAPERQQELERLPTWSWDPRADQWEQRFTLLKSYVDEHGDARVPAPYKVAGFALGSWVRDQRAHGHEKVPTGGQVEVPGFGQVKVPTLCSSC
ncbi:helicase associated domain-containing protein [Mycolicibacterium sp.]|uniref:helicase associated domain-containing protein n=1 Tax=Mycolicibacterium sp. TaxID=2320850 RepID=UPI0025D0A61B|nr:helicase associated domain-containing protein [Mycolicibacterium sp.]MCB9410142.1 helicase associated domain-containing protein [Mycolicibacterium sp.]